jgi:hypothetical protein
MTQIFHNGQSSHGGEGGEVMISTSQQGTMGSVIFLLVPTRYQSNHDRNQTKRQSGMDRNTAFLTTKYFIEYII